MEFYEMEAVLRELGELVERTYIDTTKYEKTLQKATEEARRYGLIKTIIELFSIHKIDSLKEAFQNIVEIVQEKEGK